MFPSKKGPRTSPAVKHERVRRFFANTAANVARRGQQPGRLLQPQPRRPGVHPRPR